MDKFLKTVLFSCLLMISLLGSSNGQNCPPHTFSNGNSYSTCNSLPALSSFLHWTYHQSNRTVDIAYRHTGVTASNWVVWSLNPNGQGMLGAQCLVAFRNTSGAVSAYTSAIPSSPAGYGTTLQESDLSFRVPSIGAEFTNNQMIIYATIELPPGGTSFTQVWQHGDVSGNSPAKHPSTPEHLRSFGTVDFAAGTIMDTSSASGGSRQRKRNIHGVLNVVSWGILMPMGAMAARYLKVFKSANPAWFYIHEICLTSAYIVGAAGWNTGLKLGSDSPGVEQTTHWSIGIVLFALGTLHAFTLPLRPKPDHKFRLYWNICQHAIAYAAISLSIANIFEGFDILDPAKKCQWRKAYIGVLVFLGVNAVLLEAYTWFVVLKKRKGADKHPNAVANGTKGYGA